jgi:superfamily I DNA/RNA helicase
MNTDLLLDHPGQHRLYGPPGTGKTTALARIIAQALDRGYAPESIIVISHTNAAAAEIAGRRTQLPPEAIGTLHSFAWRSLGLCRFVQTTGGKKDTTDYLGMFSEEYPHYAQGGHVDPDETSAGATDGAKLMASYQRLRATLLPRELWPAEELAFAAAWERFKSEQGGIDFEDQIHLAYLNSDHAPGDPAVIIVDEAQDLSRSQFRLVVKWGRAAERIVLAADYDQTIYEFSGADPAVFLENPIPTSHQHFLTYSHRLPAAVAEWALAWIGRNVRREAVTFAPRRDESGAVVPGEVRRSHAVFTHPEKYLLRALVSDLDAGRRCMVLASCGYMLEPLTKLLRAEGIPFWNPYRTGREGAAWNPLPRRSSKLLGFLAPWLEGGDLWTGEIVKGWMPWVKGVKRRGVTPPDTLGRSLTIAELQTVFSDESLTELLANPQDALRWLQAHHSAAAPASIDYAAGIVARRGLEGLTEPPRCIIGSVHSVKGGEADAVYVFPDLSREGLDAWNTESGREAIRRLFYVAATRARESLVLCSGASGGAVTW